MVAARAASHRVRAYAVRDLREDGVHAAERLAPERRQQERRPLRLAHAIEAEGEVAEDVEEAAEAVLRVRHRHADAAQRLLDARIGHAPSRRRRRWRRARRRGRFFTRPSEMSVSRATGGEPRRRARRYRGPAAARSHRGEHVDRLQHPVDGDGGLVDGEAKRLHGLRSQPRCLRRGELAEGPAARSSTGFSRRTDPVTLKPAAARSCSACVACVGENCVARARFDGGVVEPSQLLGRRARDAPAGDGLLEPACCVGERERGPTVAAPAVNTARPSHAELLERALDVLRCRARRGGRGS